MATHTGSQPGILFLTCSSRVLIDFFSDHGTLGASGVDECSLAE